MLEQAIIDADELKNSAKQLAEQTIIEKYSKELKSTINELLEQEDSLGFEDEMDPEMAGAPTDLGMEEPEGEVSSELQSQIPLVNTDEFNSLERDDEEITINFDELKQEIEGEMMNQRQAPLEAEATIPISITNDTESAPMSSAPLMEMEDLDEELNFPYNIVSHGHLGAPTSKELEHVDEVAKAKQVQGLEEEVENLEEQIKILKGRQSLFRKQNAKLKDIVQNLKEYVNQVNTTNAKLLYTNKVLGASSLNERQKKSMIKQITESTSVEQAKIVYETLKQTMGDLKSNTKSPKSLLEAVSGKNNSVLTANSQETEDAIVENKKHRWKKLAGIL